MMDVKQQQEAYRAASGPRNALRVSVRALRKNPNMLLGVVIVGSLSVIAIFAPLLTRTDYIRVNPAERLLPPSFEHWFGTDHLGWDVYDRTIVGSRLSLLVGSSVMAITVVAGMVIGLIAGYNRIVDNVVMRFMDALMAFPTILLALALIALLGSSVQNVIIALSVTATPIMTRLVRGATLSLRETPYVEAARAIGVPVWRILSLHIAPNTLAVVMVQATFILALAILSEATLSFLGAGTPTYIPTWGNIIASGKLNIQRAIWVVLFPGLFLSSTVLAVNLIGDGLRDALDPKLRRSL